MLSDEFWSKLEKILLQEAIYSKGSQIKKNEYVLQIMSKPFRFTSLHHLFINKAGALLKILNLFSTGGRDR